MNVDALLARLDRVKRITSQRGLHRWMACCPAHDDKTPTLSIAETASGTILLKCWAGCPAIDIVQAVGLTLADLFADRPVKDMTRQEKADVRILARRNAVEAAAYTVEHEAHVVAQAAALMISGRVPSRQALARLLQAYDRVSAARDPIRNTLADRNR